MFQLFPGVLLPEVIVFLLQHEGGGTDRQTDSVPSYMLTSLQERVEQTGLPFSTKEWQENVYYFETKAVVQSYLLPSEGIYTPGSVTVL